MPASFLDRNSDDKLRFRRNAQRMRTADLSGSIALNPNGGVQNTGTGLAIKLDGTSLTLSSAGLKLDVITTKGDLITSNGTIPVRLGVGSNGQVLTADSTQTDGIKWATPTASPTFVFSEVPAGTVDGVNTTFTLAFTPTSGTLQLYKNGLRQKAGAGNDYTLATNTITFLAGNIPQTGDILLADYQH